MKQPLTQLLFVFNIVDYPNSVYVYKIIFLLALQCLIKLFYAVGLLLVSAMVSLILEVIQQCSCFGIKCIDNTSTLGRLELGIETNDDLLDSNQKGILMEHLKSLSIDDGEKKENNDKFLGTHELISGQLKHTTEGLPSFLCLNEEDIKKIRSNPEQAIIDEVLLFSNEEVIELLHYIREEPISEKKYSNGIRDKDRPPGMCLNDFMKHPNVKKSSLHREHVIALRLYTSAAYKYINNPLRDIQRKELNIKHPLAACVLYIQEGIKKLRNVISMKEETQRQSGIIINETTILWRGMKNVHASNHFILRGGAELAPMSTTSEFQVAVEYGTCREGSLLLKIIVPTALQHGANLAWLSCFPGEAEVLYPPLTFLKSLKRKQEFKCEENGIVVNILELEPDLSA